MRPFLCLILFLAGWDWHGRFSYGSDPRRIGISCRLLKKHRILQEFGVLFILNLLYHVNLYNASYFQASFSPSFQHHHFESLRKVCRAGSENYQYD